MIRTARSFSVATAALLCLCFRRVAEGKTPCNSNRTISICPSTVLLGSDDSMGKVTISCRNANQSRAMYLHRLDRPNRQNLAFVARGQEPALNLTFKKEYKETVTISFDPQQFSMSLTFTNVSCRDAKVGYACVSEWSLKGGQSQQEDVAFFVLLRSAPSLEILPREGKNLDGTIGFKAAEDVTLMCSAQISQADGARPVHPHWEFKDNHQDPWTNLSTACRGGGDNRVQIKHGEDDCYELHSCLQNFSLAEVNGCTRQYRCFFHNGNSTDGIDKRSTEVTVPIMAGSGQCMKESTSMTAEGIVVRFLMILGVLAILVSFVIYMSRRNNTKRKPAHRKRTVASNEQLNDQPTDATKPQTAERSPEENQQSKSADFITAQVAEESAQNLYGKSVDATTALNQDAEPKDVTTTQLAEDSFQKKDDRPIDAATTQNAQGSAQSQDAKPGDATTTQPSITDAQKRPVAVNEKPSAPAEEHPTAKVPPGPPDRSTIL